MFGFTGASTQNLTPERATECLKEQKHRILFWFTLYLPENQSPNPRMCSRGSSVAQRGAGLAQCRCWPLPPFRCFEAQDSPNCCFLPRKPWACHVRPSVCCLHPSPRARARWEGWPSGRGAPKQAWRAWQRLGSESWCSGCTFQLCGHRTHSSSLPHRLHPSFHDTQCQGNEARPFNSAPFTSWDTLVMEIAG